MEAIRPEIVAGQIRAVLRDIRPVAIKVGMVNDAETIHAIASELKDCGVSHIVVDPVMVSTSGARLMQPAATDVFMKELVPLATLLTPNMPEATVLSGLEVRDMSSFDAAGFVIARNCGCHVLIKGGHHDNVRKCDRLYGTDGRLMEMFEEPTVDTCNTHGTGCTLSSAIACFLAKGCGLIEAVRQAKTYVTSALHAGADVRIGQGHGPVNHFFAPLKMEKV